MNLAFKRVSARCLASIFLFLLAPATGAAEAGLLHQFERDATREGEAAPRRQAREAEADEEDDALLEWGVEQFGNLLISGGGHSLERLAPAALQSDATLYAGAALAGTPRSTGEALIPYARIDLAHQWVSREDVTAEDVRAELGYGPFGVQLRHTRYEERDPASTLKVFQYYALYRMSLGDFMEVDMGYGRFELSGEGTYSGTSWTLPVQFHPSTGFGIEYRPAWTNINGNDIGDHELAVSVGDRYWAVRGGYRWIKSPGVGIEGPFLGLSARL